MQNLVTSMGWLLRVLTRRDYTEAQEQVSVRSLRVSPRPAQRPCHDTRCERAATSLVCDSPPAGAGAGSDHFGT